MKRSDMVQIMLEFEREAQEYHCGYQFMNNLLKKIEEHMMPNPRLPDESHREIIQFFGLDYETHQVYDWEPEDDKDG